MKIIKQKEAKVDETQKTKEPIYPLKKQFFAVKKQRKIDYNESVSPGPLKYINNTSKIQNDNKKIFKDHTLKEETSKKLNVTKEQSNLNHKKDVKSSLLNNKQMLHESSIDKTEHLIKGRKGDYSSEVKSKVTRLKSPLDELRISAKNSNFERPRSIKSLPRPEKLIDKVKESKSVILGNKFSKEIADPKNKLNKKMNKDDIEVEAIKRKIKLSLEKKKMEKKRVNLSLKSKNSEKDSKESGSVSSKKSNMSVKINEKLKERSNIAQSSFKMNLQDLMKLDELITHIMIKPSQISLDLLTSFFISHYCFLLKDLNVLFTKPDVRERLRKLYLYEVVFFVYLFFLILKNQNILEIFNNEHPSIRMNQAFQAEFDELLIQIMSHVHIIFVMRCEIFIDRAAVYYQNNKIYKQLLKLISKRKSKYNLITLDKENMDSYLERIERYIDLTEQAIHELVKLNASVVSLVKDLLVLLKEIEKRKGELTIEEFNMIFKKLKIRFDERGITNLDFNHLQSYISLPGNYRFSQNESRKHDSMCQIDDYISFDKANYEAEFVKPPFIKAERDPRRSLTLVLDLDETLIHFPEENLQKMEENSDIVDFKIRPFCIEFLEEISNYFEIIIFTAASQNYADIIVDILDKNKRISYRLYRQHMSIYNKKLIKDVSKIGRDLRSLIILDNIPENFILQSDNGVYVKSWRGDPNDKCLFWLSTIFSNIGRLKPFDVRKVLLELKNLLISDS